MIPLLKYSNPYLGQLKFSSGVKQYELLVDVTTLRVKLTCGKFNWMGMIWKGTHILNNKRSNNWKCISEQKSSPEVKITACRAQKQVCVKPHIWGRVQKKNLLHWKERKGKESGVWPSMVTHTRNLSSAFNPSKCTLTAVNTHLEQWAAILRRPGSSWGIGALLKGLTSVVVLKVERVLVIQSPHRQSLPDLGIEPATFGLQVQLSNH